MTVKWKPQDYHNEYREKLEHFIDKKLHELPKSKRKKTTKQAETKPSNVINFVDLLKRSINNRKKRKLK